MGELILCSQQLAAMPYYIENVSLNVYRLSDVSVWLLYERGTKADPEYTSGNGT